MMKRTLTVLVIALLVVGFALPGAMAGHKDSHSQGRADVAKKGPMETDNDLTVNDDDGTTVGVQVNPSAGTSRTVQVTVTVDDDNGHNDVSTVEVTIMKPDNATVQVSTSTASKQTGNGKRGTYSYNFNMQYFDAAGTYHVNATVTDRDGLTETAWASFEWQELAALALSTSSVSLNPDGNASMSVNPDSDTHGNPATVTVENHGNVKIDLQYSGTNLTSVDVSDEIAVTNVHWSDSDTLSPENSFSTLLQTNMTFDLVPGNGSTKDVYLAIHIPNVQSATYTGTLTLTAVKG